MDSIPHFEGLPGYLLVLAVVLTPIILPFANAAAKRVLAPKTEEVAEKAAEEAQQQAARLTTNLSAAWSASLEREAKLQARVAELETELAAKETPGDGKSAPDTS